MDKIAITAQASGVGFASEQSRRLFWYVHSCAHFSCTKSYDCDRRSYDGHQLMFIVRGRGPVSYDGRELEAGPGDVVVMDLRRPHRYRCPADPWEMFWVIFEGPGVAAIFQAILDANGGSAVVPYTSQQRMRSDFAGIFRRLKHHKPGDEVWVWQHLTSLVANVMERLPAASTADVAAAVRLMRAEYARTIALDELARVSGLSIFHFTRRFKRSTGFTPMEYLEKLRVVHAQELMQNHPHLLSKDIAKQSGYVDPAYFSRVFHKRVGVSPSAYKKSLHG
jgi:AraC-like DNA-binding protein